MRCVSFLALGALAAAAIGVLACGDGFQTGAGGGGGATTTTTVTTSNGGGGSSTTSSGGGADPACEKGERCIPAVPQGWVGPLAIETSTSVDGNPAPCGEGFDSFVTAFVGPIDSPPVSCHGCGCSSPNDVECGPPTIELHANPNCAGGATDYSGPAPGAEGVCAAITPANALSGKIVLPSEPVTGSCMPSGGGIASAPDATWSGRAATCQASALGAQCSGGGVCAPKPNAPYANVCVAQDGKASGCPSGFDNQLVVYKDQLDMRACTECACGAPTGGSCGTSVAMSNASPCDTQDKALASGCVTASTAWNFLKWVANPSQLGTCASTGGDPTGSVVPDKPVTLCCVDSI